MDEIVRILCRQINVCIGSRVRIPHSPAAVLREDADMTSLEDVILWEDIGI